MRDPASLKAIEAVGAGDGMALAQLKDIFITDALAKTAVESDGLALQFVPDALRTVDVCETAITQTMRALAFVPLEVKNDPRFQLYIDRLGKQNRRESPAACCLLS